MAKQERCEMKMFPELTEIRKLREKVGWSQVELAEKAGVSQSTIPKYEKGYQVPSYDIAKRIFQILYEEEWKNDVDIEDIMTPNVLSVKLDGKLKQAIDLMRQKSISQLPVMWNGKSIGTITESKLLDLFNDRHSFAKVKQMKASEVMGSSLPSVPRRTKLKAIIPLLQYYGAVLVTDAEGNIIGIVTKADLLDV